MTCPNRSPGSPTRRPGTARLRQKMFMSKADWGKWTGAGSGTPVITAQPSFRDTAITPHNACNHGQWFPFWGGGEGGGEAAPCEVGPALRPWG